MQKKWTKIQTMVDKILHRKLKIEDIKTIENGCELMCIERVLVPAPILPPLV